MLCTGWGIVQIMLKSQHGKRPTSSISSNQTPMLELLNFHRTEFHWHCYAGSYWIIIVNNVKGQRKLTRHCQLYFVEQTTITPPTRWRNHPMTRREDHESSWTDTRRWRRGVMAASIRECVAQPHYWWQLMIPKWEGEALYGCARDRSGEREKWNAVMT